MSIGVMGKAQIAVNTSSLANGDSIAAYLVDASGNLLTSQTIASVRRLDVNIASEFADGSAWSAGNYGNEILAVRKDASGAFSGVADGDYSPLQLDSNGLLKVVSTISGDLSYVYAEDAGHSSGDKGAFVLAVRQDTLANSTSADGDFAAFKLNTKGELYVIDSDANAELDTISGNISTMLTELQSITFNEDSAHSSGDAGLQFLAVRNDNNSNLTSADGDYSPIAVDSAGRLKVVSTGGFAEDAAASNGDMGTFVLSVRRDSVGANTSANGDYAELQTNARGELRVINKVEGSSLQQKISVTTTAAALPGTALANRKHILIQNVGSSSVYLGSATVTSSGSTQGAVLSKGNFWEADIAASVDIYGIVASGTVDVIVWEFA